MNIENKSIKVMVTESDIVEWEQKYEKEPEDAPMTINGIPNYLVSGPGYYEFKEDTWIQL